jgi:hypothetical protein
MEAYFRTFLNARSGDKIFCPSSGIHYVNTNVRHAFIYVNLCTVGYILEGRGNIYVKHSFRDTKSININTLQLHELFPCKMAERTSLFHCSSILYYSKFISPLLLPEQENTNPPVINPLMWALMNIIKWHFCLGNNIFHISGWNETIHQARNI